MHVRLRFMNQRSSAFISGFLRLLMMPLLAIAFTTFAATPASPALVLVIMVDQFRADYLARFQPYFVPGGIRLFLEQGANFSDCIQRHAVTKTAPGHAVVLTGVHANVHGIINNAWIDRATLKRGNCVDDDSVQILGAADDKGGVRLPGAI